MSGTYRNATQALYTELIWLQQFGVEVEVRGSKTKERLYQTLNIEYPAERCIYLEGRNDNIFAKIAETLWVLAGRNDILWLERYLPRAKEWSDDGRTWRAGYGPRIRAWDGKYFDPYFDPIEADKIDQLQKCIRLLQMDPTTRQAVMVIFDPVQDYNSDSKDIPCNNWVQFLLRDGYLHMGVTQRSSDIIWGLSGINLFEFSVLQEVVANILGAKLGTLNYFIGSLHLYERHYDRAARMIRCNKNSKVLEKDYPGMPTPIRGIKSLGHLDLTLVQIFQWEHKFREGDYEMPLEHEYDPFFYECLRMLAIYNAYLNKDTVENIAKMVNMLAPTSDFRHAAAAHFKRLEDN